jgi:hypothetical protein
VEQRGSYTGTDIGAQQTAQMVRHAHRSGQVIVFGDAVVHMVTGFDNFRQGQKITDVVEGSVMFHETSS